MFVTAGRQPGLGKAQNRSSSRDVKREPKYCFCREMPSTASVPPAICPSAPLPKLQSASRVPSPVIRGAGWGPVIDSPAAGVEEGNSLQGKRRHHCQKKGAMCQKRKKNNRFTRDLTLNTYFQKHRFGLTCFQVNKGFNRLQAQQGCQHKPRGVPPSVRLCPLGGSRASSAATPCCTCTARTFTIVSVLPWVALPLHLGSGTLFIPSPAASCSS